MWTKENPSKPGLYWLRDFTLPDGFFIGVGVAAEMTVVQIYRLDGDGGLSVALLGTEVEAELSDVEGEWHGPIYPSD
jgi:hypothetical protein